MDEISNLTIPQAVAMMSIDDETPKTIKFDSVAEANAWRRKMGFDGV